MAIYSIRVTVFIIIYYYKSIWMYDKVASVWRAMVVFD